MEIYATIDQLQEVRRLRGFKQNAITKMQAHAKYHNFVLNIVDKDYANPDAVTLLLATWKIRRAAAKELLWPLWMTTAHEPFTEIVVVYNRKLLVRDAFVGDNRAIEYTTAPVKVQNRDLNPRRKALDDQNQFCYILNRS